MRAFVFICALVLQGNAASLNADRDLEMPPLPEEERDLEMPVMPAEDDRAYDEEMPMPEEVRAEKENEETMQVRGRININIETAKQKELTNENVFFLKSGNKKY